VTTSVRPYPSPFDEPAPDERPSAVEPIPSSELRRTTLASAAYDLAVGDLINGKFRVERIIGEGGMGLVVSATHLGLDERVALKMLHPSARKSPEAVARFFQEAKAAAKLKSEHVAHVLDVSQRADGAPFIVMEFLRGNDLRSVLGIDGPLAVGTVADYMIQACEGLAEAHARGIIHRDIKPENLFLTERSEGWRIVKILDFGISKALLSGSTLSAANIQTGAIMGSPSYMSPEQLRETSSVDHRTDIWALGAVMFELLTGKAPFDSSRPLTALILEILQNDPPLVSALKPHIPAELAAIVARCLAKERDQRFSTAADLAVALLPFAPRRARVAAERAIAITKESGLAGVALVMPVTHPPAMGMGATGLDKTALALDFAMPPISAKQIVTHPDLIAEMGRNARTRSWAYVALAAIGALTMVAVLAIFAAAPAPRAVPEVRVRVSGAHVRAARDEARAERPEDVADVAAPRPPGLPSKLAAPRPAAPAPPPSAPAPPSLEIRGSR
jgi:eukaryotic-like serine/threonine-protein kinase